MGVGQFKKGPDKKKNTVPKNETFMQRMLRIKKEAQQNVAKSVPNKKDAPKVAKNTTQGTVSKGTDKITASNKKIQVNQEALLKKPVKLKSFKIDDVTIKRKTEGKKTTFIVGGKPINLAKWIQERTKDREKKQIDTALKPFAAFFKKVKLSEKDRALKLKQLTDRIKARGAVSPGLMSQAAQLSQLALTQKNPTQFTVRSTLKLHYGRVLPPRVDTMIIKRPDGTKIVCMRDDGVPGHPYRDLATLKVIYPRKGDLVDVVRVSPSRAELMANKEKDKNKRKKATYGGGYSGGGGGRSSGGGGGYSGLDKSSVPSSSGYIKPISGNDLSKVNIERTPDGWPKNLDVSHVDMPTKRLFCTLIKPKRKPKPGERIMKMVYLTGKGKSNDYTKWREGPGKLKPPRIVAEAITRKYFSFKAKKAVAEWQAKMAKSGVYPVIAFMSEVHTKSKNPSSSWYNDWTRANSVQGIFDNVFTAIEKNIPTDSAGKKIKHDRKVGIACHSMGGRAVKWATTFAGKGKLKNVQILGTFNSDSSYWNMDSQIFLAKKHGTKLYLTSRRGTSTAKLAFRVIRSFGLVDSKGVSPKIPGKMRDGLYTSTKYPNVVVRMETGTGHGTHPKFIGAAANHIMASSKKVKVA